MFLVCMSFYFKQEIQTDTLLVMLRYEGERGWLRTRKKSRTHSRIHTHTHLTQGTITCKSSRTHPFFNRHSLVLRSSKQQQQSQERKNVWCVEMDFDQTFNQHKLLLAILYGDSKYPHSYSFVANYCFFSLSVFFSWIIFFSRFIHSLYSIVNCW